MVRLRAEPLRHVRATVAISGKNVPDGASGTGPGGVGRYSVAVISPAQADELATQVRDGLVAYASPDGVTMPSAAWLVTAQGA